jgi:NAD(P)-dependent dehydrogenase (short-subunit alcohol dehydrogenase family)
MVGHEETGEDDPARARTRVAVVTGAARGIGREVAVALAGQGMAVAGIDIAGPVSEVLDYPPATAQELEETGERVRKQGANWVGIEADQRDIVEVRTAAERIERELGLPEVVFANAGVQAFKPLLEMDDADWHDQIAVNLHGTANVLRVFAPLLVRRGGGRIIITSSSQGRRGTLFGAAYSASQWGLIGLMKSAALELGRHGVTVNAVVPGAVDTAPTRNEDRYAQAIGDAGRRPTGERDDEETARELLAARNPMRAAWIDPADVAPVVVFLASEQAGMVSGASFAVDGGDSARITA